MTRRVVLAVGVAAAIVLAGGVVWAAEQSGPLPSKVHIMKSSNRLMKFVTRSQAIAPDTFDIPDIGTSEDPTIHGATLVFRDLGVPAATSSATIYLYPSGWSGLGNPAGSKGYKYKGKKQGGVPGDCRVVLIKPKIIKAVCKDVSFFDGYIEHPYIGAAAISLRIPIGAPDFASTAIEYCHEFGGDLKKNSFDLMKAKNAPAPAICQNLE